MQAKEYWVIMCSDQHDKTISECLYVRETVSTDFGCEDSEAVELKFDTKPEALTKLAELTAQFPNTVYTLYHLVPTEHTTHKR